MKFHYGLILLLIPAIILSLGCEDAQVVGGKVILSTDVSSYGVNNTALVNKSVGERSEGYAEISFNVVASTCDKEENNVNIFARAHSMNEFISCSFHCSSGGLAQIYSNGNYRHGVTFTSPIANGTHKLGCEVLNSEDAEQVNVKLLIDDVVLVEYSLEAHEVRNVGKFGFGGASENGEFSVNSFTFFDRRP